MQLHDHSRLYAVLGSLSVHAALAAVLAFQIVSSVGTSMSQRPKPAIIAVRLTDFEAVMPSPARPPRPILSAHMTAVHDNGAAIAVAPRDAAPIMRSPIAGEGPGAPPVPGASSGDTAQMAGSILSDYENALRDHLERFFEYPEAARSDRLGGTVELHVVISRDGRLLSEWIKQSSGYSVLDVAALDLVHRAAPLPPLLPGMPDAIEVSLPLEYAPPRIMLGAR